MRQDCLTHYGLGFEDVEELFGFEIYKVKIGVSGKDDDNVFSC